MVFSGPANDATLPATVRTKFDRCIREDEAESCDISPIVWSPGSKNAVPVANEHSMGVMSMEEKHRMANVEFQKIHTHVMKILSDLADFEEEELEVVLFSAEGDSLHQIFDCIAMGPYARMDFWTSGSDGSLPVPYWSRDTAGSGDNRNIDLPCGPDKIGTDLNPPFTCGSETRRAIIKYFVRDEINGNREGNSLTEELVQKQIKKLMDAWSDPSKYACRCTDGTNSLTCCTCEDDTCIIPDNLDVPYDLIESEDVLEHIVKRIPPYWEKVFAKKDNEAFLKWANSDAKESYRWENNPVHTAAAVNEHVYAWDRPVMFYNGSEIGSPFRNTTLWETCTGLLSQVLFTLPVRQQSTGAQWSLSKLVGVDKLPEFDPTNDRDPPYDRSPTETFIEKAMRDAYTDSSTFWHHALRYVPSKSIACSDATYSPPGSNARVRFVDRDGITPPNFSNPSVPMLGFNAYPIGATRSMCFCGWSRVGTKCIIPGAVCRDIGRGDNCDYVHGTASGRDIIATVLDMWKKVGANRSHWTCPELDLSDAWGILPQDDGPVKGGGAYKWVTEPNATSIEVDIKRILVDGRAGLRIGNINHLSGHARVGGLNPGKRVHQKESTYNDSIDLRKCKDTIFNTFDAASVAIQVVDDLFPVAYAAKEGGPTSVCLRFAIEYARLRVMETIHAAFKGVNKLGEQRTLYDTWKKRCHMQLQMVGMCRSNGVYAMIPDEQKVYRCPFHVSDPYNGTHSSGYYVTPGCLVYHRDSVYDPCKMQSDPCSSSKTISIADLVADAAHAKLPFDPRMVGSDEALGVWPVEFSSNKGPDANAKMALAVDKIEEWRASSSWLPWRLSEGFVAANVMGGGSATPGGMGNTPKTKTWGTAEGFEDNIEFCDAMADWWPDDWSMPVGYHVTVPCDKDETGYRTFDHAFAIDRGNGEVVFVYENDILRDHSKYHSHFGTSGVCRGGVYGMPQYLTKTMRVCTKDQEGASYDASVPVKPKDGSGWEEEKCSDSPFDTPWSLDNSSTAPPSMLAVGCVPNWFAWEEWTTSTRYPADDVLQTHVKNTRPGISGTMSWARGGAGCGPGNLLSCITPADCVSTHSSVPMKCVRNVCVVSEPERCYQHSDCSGAQQLCAGDGRCTQGVWEVENAHGSDIEFQLYAENCTAAHQDDLQIANKFDTYGTSPWETVPDILRMFGMCSYRQWFETLEFWNPKDANHSNTAGKCIDDDCGDYDFVATRSIWWNTSADPDSKLQTLWEMEKFRMKAHECDMDYMYIRHLPGCSPMPQNGMSDVDILETNRERSMLSSRNHAMKKLMRMYNTNRHIRIGGNYTMKLEHSVGFVGITDEQFPLGDKAFQPCMNIPQCAVAPFTVDGVPTTRTVLDNGKIRQYETPDYVECGSIGYVDTNTKKCKLDRDVLPLYEVVCGSNPPTQCNSVTVGMRALLDIVCRDIGAVNGLTPNSRTTIRAAVNAVNRLADMFVQENGISTSSQYLRAMDCSNELYSRISNTTQKNPGMKSFVGMYYVTEYSTVEYHFSWWHKCMVMQGRKFEKDIVPDKQEILTCPEWSDDHIAADAMETQDYSTDTLRLLNRIEGGITTEMVNEAVSQLRAAILAGAEAYAGRQGGTGRDFKKVRCDVIGCFQYRVLC
jgi:hypothetical protein